MDKVKLEQQADLLFENLAGWEEKALQRIGTRIDKIGRMTVADVRTLNNIADVKGDIDIIMRELAEVTGYNISQVQKIYGEILSEQHLENKYLYDYRNKDFVPFADNKELQSIVRAYSKSTAETMINLSKTSMIGFFDDRTGFHGIQTAYYDAVDKAVMAVTSGATDFNTAMRDTLKSLGGSGVRVNYGGGVTRRIDTVIRQNLLWGAKQASNAYMDMIGEELDCDGFEVDWHSNPRPSHEFMQGKQFAYGKARTVNGVYYPSGDEALQRLQDYNCYHFKTPIILGVSESTYSQDELERLNRQNAEVFKIGDIEGNGYFWSQKMRQLETEIRKQKDTRILAKASSDNTLVRQCNERMGVFQKKYDEIAAITGIKPDYERMSVTRAQNVLKSSKENDIIFNESRYIAFDSGKAVNDFFYYDSDERGMLAKKNSEHGKWISSLSQEQRMAIGDYCADGYDDINSYWRKYGDWQSINEEKVLSETKELDNAIASYNLKNDIKVYRAVQPEVFQDYWGDIQKLVGQEYTDQAFMSTSPFKGSTAVNKDCIMEIFLPAGRGRGAYVNNLSGFQDEEYEFLLARGSKFRIISVEETEEKLIIKMELITNDR